MNPSAIKQLALKKPKKAQCFSRRKGGITFIQKKKAFVTQKKVENPSVLVVHSTTGKGLTKNSVR